MFGVSRLSLKVHHTGLFITTRIALVIEPFTTITRIFSPKCLCGLYPALASSFSAGRISKGITRLKDERPKFLELKSFGTELNVAVIGATGGIGGALADQLGECPSVSNVFSFSRSAPNRAHKKLHWTDLDLIAEHSISGAAVHVKQSVGELHFVIAATGVLHDGFTLTPEKSWSDLNGPSMQLALQVNTIGPALVAKHFLPLLAKNRKTIFAALSARVGSIGNNHLGGWYAYRASKAALNMIIKTLSLELARRNPNAICVGLHPGTVDTPLSKPFQSGVAQRKLFSPRQSARYLLNVLDGLGPQILGTFTLGTAAACRFSRQLAVDCSIVPSATRRASPSSRSAGRLLRRSSPHKFSDHSLPYECCGDPRSARYRLPGYCQIRAVGSGVMTS